MVLGIGQSLSPTDKSRLEQQQKYITTALGFALHPTIRQALARRRGKEIRIAVVSEITVGTDADSSLDILWTQISPREVSSSTGLDPELVQHFDAVAVNLLHTSLESDQWKFTMQNLLDLLKPEGWVQWVDFDPVTARIAGSTPGTPDAVSTRSVLRNYTDALQARKVGSTYRISNLFKSQGLLDTDSDLYPIAPDGEFTRIVASGALKYLEQTDHLSAVEVSKTEAQIEDEIQVSGPLVWYDLWCHIAQASKG